MNNIIHFMARLSLLYSLLWSISIHAYAHSRDTDPNSTYPTPDRLFHIARSLNRNLVFDRDTKQITNDPEANKMLCGVPPRKGWEQYYTI